MESILPHCMQCTPEIQILIGTATVYTYMVKHVPQHSFAKFSHFSDKKSAIQYIN